MALLTTYNGWVQATPAQLTRVHVGGLSAQVRAGDVAVVLAAFLVDFAREVEAIERLYGWRSIATNTAVGGDPRSTHLSGTAVDVNGHVHPWEKRTGTARYPARGGFTTKQLAALRKVLARYDGAIAWGGDYARGIRDAMHFDIRATAAAVAAAAARIRSTQEDDVEITDQLGYPNPKTRKPYTAEESWAVGANYSVYTWDIVRALDAKVTNLVGAVAALAQGEDFDEAKLLAGVEASAAEGAKKGTAAALAELEPIIREAAGVNADAVLDALRDRLG